MSEEGDDIYVASNGLVYCKAHRREVCYVCCHDHRNTNELHRAGPDADTEAILERLGQIQQAELDAVMRQHVAEGGRGPLVLGSEHADRLFQAVAAQLCTVRSAGGPSAAVSVCLRGCNYLQGHAAPASSVGASPHSLSAEPTLGYTSANPPNVHLFSHLPLVAASTRHRCSRCKVAYYCSREHQLLHYPAHKRECKSIAAAKTGVAGGRGAGSGAAAAAAAGSSAGSSGAPAAEGGAQPAGKAKLVSWRQLEGLQGQPAGGLELQLRVLTEPVPFMGHIFEGGASSQPPILALGRLPCPPGWAHPFDRLLGTLS